MITWLALTATTSPRAFAAFAHLKPIATLQIRPTAAHALASTQTMTFTTHLGMSDTHGCNPQFYR